MDNNDKSDAMRENDQDSPNWATHLFNTNFISDLMVEVSAQQQKNWASFNRALAELTSQQMASVSTLTKAIADESSRQLTQALAPLLEQQAKILKEADADSKDVGPLLLSAGLWVPPSAPLTLFHRLKQLSQTAAPTSDKVRDVFIQFFEQDDWGNLRTIVSRWRMNPRFAPRMSIILDALEAHTAGKYTLSIPALLPQVDGIASDILELPARSGGKLFKKVRLLMGFKEVEVN